VTQHGQPQRRFLLLIFRLILTDVLVQRALEPHLLEFCVPLFLLAGFVCCFVCFIASFGGVRLEVFVHLAFVQGVNDGF